MVSFIQMDSAQSSPFHFDEWKRTWTISLIFFFVLRSYVQWPSNLVNCSVHWEQLAALFSVVCLFDCMFLEIRRILQSFQVFGWATRICGHSALVFLCMFFPRIWDEKQSLRCSAVRCSWLCASCLEPQTMRNMCVCLCIKSLSI